MARSARAKVLDALRSGPCTSGAIIERLHYPTGLVLALDRAIGDNRRGSWDGSDEQKALGKLPF